LAIDAPLCDRPTKTTLGSAAAAVLPGEADQCIVNRLVAVRMEIAHHVADDFRRFLERGTWIEAQQPHAVEDAPVHGF